MLTINQMQELLNHYNEVSGKTRAWNEETEKQMTKSIGDHTYEEMIDIIDELRGSQFWVTFDKASVESAYSSISLRKEVAELKAKQSPLQDTTNAMNLMAKAMMMAIKEEHGEEIANELKAEVGAWLKETFGITERPIKLVSPVTGKPLESVTHERFEDVLTFVNVGIPAMLVGPAGTGKNIICEQVAESLGYEYYDANAVQNAYDLTGFIDANGTYQETEFYRACKSASEGKDTLFVFDEIDGSNAEVMVQFNNALANGRYQFPTEVLTFKEHLHVVACANTFGTGASFEYVGRNQLDSATLNRFAVIEINYSPRIEESLTENTELLSFVRDFRNKLMDAGIKHVVSYRNIKQINSLLSVGYDEEKALKECLIKNLEVNDLSMISNRLSSNHFASIIKDIVNRA